MRVVLEVDQTAWPTYTYSWPKSRGFENSRLQHRFYRMLAGARARFRRTPGLCLRRLKPRHGEDQGFPHQHRPPRPPRPPETNLGKKQQTNRKQKRARHHALLRMYLKPREHHRHRLLSQDLFLGRHESHRRLAYPAGTASSDNSGNTCSFIGDVRVPDGAVPAGLGNTG